MRNVVHEERFELSLEPENRLIGLHVHIKSAEDTFFFCVDVLDDVQIIHINGDSYPVE